MGAYFAISLIIFTLAGAIIALLDRFCFQAGRERELALAESAGKLKDEERKAILKPPFMAEYARSLFWVLLLVLVIRSFIGEPFRIPSGSMLPTLQIGDFIIVKKYAYGIYTPVWRYHLFGSSQPQRGDVVVFHYPVNPHVDFIKRLVGLPGDHISYINKQLYVNGKAVKQRFVKSMIEPSDSLTQPVKEYKEVLGSHAHMIFNEPWAPTVNFKDVVVPKGEYMMMGDNRDGSEDSRFWGFVPRADILGKAVMVWMSYNGRHKSMKDIVRWSRIGRWIV